MNYRQPALSSRQNAGFKVLLQREPGNAEYWRQLAGVQSLDQTPGVLPQVRCAWGLMKGAFRFAQDLDNLRRAAGQR